MFFDIALWFWIANVFGDLKVALITLTIFAFAGALFSSIFYGAIAAGEYDSVDDDNIGKLSKVPKTLAILGIVFLIVSSIIPSKEVAYIMIGAKVADVAVQNPNVQQIGGKAYKLLELKLDEYLQETINKELPKKEEENKPQQ